MKETKARTSSYILVVGGGWKKVGREQRQTVLTKRTRAATDAAAQD